MRIGKKRGKEFSSEQIERLLNSCVGKTLGEIDAAGVFERYANSNKGIAGDVIEQSVLGQLPDNKQYPDIVVDGVETEVKTTGLKVGRGKKDTFEAKEPMSVTAVSMGNIWREDFATSALWHKLEHLLVIYYLYEGSRVPTSAWSSFKVMGWDYWDWSDDERAVLESDWTIVRDFVLNVMIQYPTEEDRKSKWPLISTKLNPQLMFLGTAPKYPNSPRFRLKRTVVTALWQASNGKNLEQLRSGFSSYQELDERLHELTVEYSGKTMGELAVILGYNGTKVSKQIAASLVVRMLGGKSKRMSQVALFVESGLIGKCVRVTSKGTKTEDTKLFRIDLSEIGDPDATWEESSFRAGFSGMQLLCIVFEKPSATAKLSESQLLGFKRLAFEDSFVENDVRSCWDNMRETVLSGNLRNEFVRTKSGKIRKTPKNAHRHGSS